MVGQKSVYIADKKALAPTTFYVFISDLPKVVGKESFWATSSPTLRWGSRSGYTEGAKK